METPYTDHITAEDYKLIYEPAEDSFLLLDALEADLVYLEQLKPQVCVEIGSGSGIIITELSKKLKSTLCLATDINPHACKITKLTSIRNSGLVETIHCNLVDALQPNSIDLLIFNPPYVVTTDEELQQPEQSEFKITNSSIREDNTKRELIYSWAGGKDGRRVIDELLKKLGGVLSPHGVFYLLLLRENKPDEIISELSKLNFKAQKFMERRIPGEYLYILKITRENRENKEGS